MTKTMTTVSIVSIENDITNYRIKFPQVTILITNFALSAIGKRIEHYGDKDPIKDEINGTEYRLNFIREVVTIVRDQEEDVEVYFYDFNTACDEAVECAENAMTVATIYGPKIFTEVILKAVEHNKPVVVNEMAHFGHRILGYDGFAFEVTPWYGTNSSRDRRFILHSHVHTIGILE